MMDQEHTKRFPGNGLLKRVTTLKDRLPTLIMVSGRPMRKEDVEKIVQAV